MLLAAVFFLHGSQKAFGWFGGNGWAATMDSWSSPEGLGLSPFFAALAITAEFLAAIALFLGLFTRLAALAVAGMMIGAIVLVPADAGLISAEYPFALFMVSLSLAFTGGGRLSMDRSISSLLMPAY
jgi:putative oxidoreductase